MKLQYQHTARIMFLAAALIAGRVAAQPMEDASQAREPLESLVLALNLISSTHARPATGVVLAGDTETGTALVLVPADFVHAGDEIIVLDGGNDIQRHGRSTRTVARSAQAGVAILEVAGLVRPGVALASDEWPGSASASYAFAAWPGAAALAEGAGLIRHTISAGSDLPEMTGPVFDACGNLAAVRLWADEGRMTPSADLDEFLADFEIPHTRAACTKLQFAEEREVAEEATEQGKEVESEPAVTPNTTMPQSPVDTVSTLKLTPAQKTGLVIAWVILGLLALAHYSRRNKRKDRRPKAVHVVLERRTETGQRFHHRIKLESTGREGSIGQGVLERQGLTLHIKKAAGGYEVSTPEDERSSRVGFFLDGTPCLGGEKFLVRGGQEIRLGDETFRLLADSEQPETKQ